MPPVIKSYLHNLVEDLPFWRNYCSTRERAQLNAWETAGRQTPPPHIVKQRIIAAYASSFNASIFIETGTFRGDMVNAMRDRFKTIYSIELSSDLCKLAQRRFRSHSHIQIIHGDSGEILPKILAGISGVCLFWLDGHYSAGDTAKAELNTPIINELHAALDGRNASPVILIDDARYFDGSNDYPSLQQVQEIVAVKRSNYECHSSNDIIRIHPSGTIRSDF